MMFPLFIASTNMTIMCLHTTIALNLQKNTIRSVGASAIHFQSQANCSQPKAACVDSRTRCEVQYFVSIFTDYVLTVLP